jgi:hypothetical protein
MCTCGCVCVYVLVCVRVDMITTQPPCSYLMLPQERVFQHTCLRYLVAVLECETRTK